MTIPHMPQDCQVTPTDADKGVYFEYNQHPLAGTVVHNKGVSGRGSAPANVNLSWRTRRRMGDA